MKSYLPIIASLFLVSAPFIPPVTATATEIIAQNIAPHIKNNIAREITVKITSAIANLVGCVNGVQRTEIRKDTAAIAHKFKLVDNALCGSLLLRLTHPTLLCLTT